MEIERIKKLYSIICDGGLGDDPHSVLIRVAIIEQLEKATGKNFRNTHEFHIFVSQFISREGEKQIPQHKLFRKKRKRIGLNQDQIARLLKVDRRTIIRWENGNIPLTSKAIQWIYQKDPIEVTSIEGTDISSQEASYAGV